MRLKTDELSRILAKAGYSVAGGVDRGAPHPVVERRHPDEPLAPDCAQESDSAQYFVRVVSYRVRLLDEDNLCEKFHIDALRYSLLLPSDAPSRCRIITTQEKVRTKAEEKTVITIERILP